MAYSGTSGSHRWSLSLALSALWLCFGGTAALAFESEPACECYSWAWSVWNNIDDADVLFVGTVEAERWVGPSDVAWQVSAFASYKGNVATSLEVLATDETGQAERQPLRCDDHLGANVGREAVFFGRERDGMLVVDRCDPWISPEYFEELIEPAPLPDGSGEAFAVALGWHGESNVHVLDGAGRRLAAARLEDAEFNRGMQCGTSSVIAITATTSAGLELVFFDVVQAAEVDRRSVDDQLSSWLWHCYDDQTVVGFTRPGTGALYIDEISAEGSTRLVSVADSGEFVAMSWPYIAIPPARGEVSPIEVWDLRSNTSLGVVEVETDRAVDRVGFIENAEQPPALLWVSTFDRELGRNYREEVFVADLLAVPFESGPPHDISGGGSVPAYLEEQGLASIEIDDQEVRWLQADGSELGREFIRDIVPGRDGEIVGSSAGIAFLDQGTATIVSPFDRASRNLNLVALEGMPPGVAPVVPSGLPAPVAVNAGGRSYAVDLPTVDPPPQAPDFGDVAGQGPDAVAIFLAVGLVLVVGLGVYGACRRLRFANG